MTLTAKLAYTDQQVAKTIGWLPWCRLYEDGKDVTESFTYIQLLDRITQPVRYTTRGGRSRRY